MKEVAISLPFRVDGFGKIAVATSQEKIWDDRVFSVLNTAQGTRVLRPFYGVPLDSLNQELMADVEDQITSIISDAFEHQLSYLTLDHVDVTTDLMGGAVTATVYYTLPNGKTAETVVGVAQLNGSDPLTEVQ